MNIHPDDPRLTAYILGELPADEAAAIEHAVAADPALQAAVKDLEIIRQLLTETLAPTSATLNPAQRLNIIRSAKSGNEPAVPADPGKSWKRWLPPLAIAAGITAAVFLALQPMEEKSATADSNTTTTPAAEELHAPTVRLLPAPGPKDAGNPAKPARANPVAASALPALRARNYLAAADFPTLELPVQSGKSSLEWIREAILTKHQMPDHNAVRLEEILNCFPLRLNGVTGIARLPSNVWHPDNRNTGPSSHAATISTETLACPWKPSATLVLISIRGNPYSECELKAVFRANAGNVNRYRLLGFAPVEGMDPAPLPALLPAKSATTLVIEVEPSSASGDLGVIEWSVNQHDAAPLTVIRPGDTEPSDDARFAALICTYAQWLAGDPSGTIDVELLAALAREIASESLSGDRSEFLHLIDQSLNL